MSIRTPASGSRLTEGETFTLSALISDNRQVLSATYFIEEVGGAVLDETVITGAELAAAVDAGSNLSVLVVVGSISAGLPQGLKS